MSPAEYIESGMLELYASGAVSPAEKQEVERMAAQHPAVREALDAILADFENYASLHAVEPDPELRDRVLNSIFNPAATTEKGKVVSLPENPASSVFWKVLAAAASVLLILSIGMNISFYSKNKEAEELKDQYANNYQVSDKKLTEKETELNKAKTELAFLLNPMTQSVMLNTTDTAHPMKAVVHWDMDTKMVAVDPMTLPQTSSDQMYVLWAVVDGKAINKGAFTVSDSTGIVMMQSIPDAEAFAISLETKPDVPQHEGPIYVLGKPAPSLP